MADLAATACWVVLCVQCFFLVKFVINIKSSSLQLKPHYALLRNTFYCTWAHLLIIAIAPRRSLDSTTTQDYFPSLVLKWVANSKDAFLPILLPWALLLGKCASDVFGKSVPPNGLFSTPSSSPSSPRTRQGRIISANSLVSSLPSGAVPVEPRYLRALWSIAAFIKNVVEKPGLRTSNHLNNILLGNSEWGRFLNHFQDETSSQTAHYHFSFKGNAISFISMFWWGLIFLLRLSLSICLKVPWRYHILSIIVESLWFSATVTYLVAVTHKCELIVSPEAIQTKKKSNFVFDVKAKSLHVSICSHDSKYEHENESDTKCCICLAEFDTSKKSTLSSPLSSSSYTDTKTTVNGIQSPSTSQLLRLDAQLCASSLMLTCCCHKFHIGCLLSWLQWSPTCPICRSVISELVT